MADNVRVAILGATGYGGVGVASCLLSHPAAELVWVGSNTFAGRPLAEACPWLRSLTQLVCRPENPEEAGREADVVFMAMQKGDAMKWAPIVLGLGKRVIDLSGDFRLRDPKVYEEWYGIAHSSPELCAEAVYGLPELHEHKIRVARLVANTGCYPVGPILGLYPLLREGLIEPQGIVVDAKSGVSGAGRARHTLAYHFPELNESMAAYRVGEHQHTPEIEQALSEAAGRGVLVSFTPHLIPVTRGIVATMYATARSEADECRHALLAAYGNRPFVRVLPEGQCPSTKATFASNFCDLAVFDDRRTGRVIVLSALDNLARGAATQAVQAMNIMLGLEQRLGLPAVPVFP
jgi:N-acetyl-gamma-glutamyl-phosphate reductase